jgi:hypothetical protein
MARAGRGPEASPAGADAGPPPGTDQEVTIEGLSSSPLASVVEGIDGGGVRLAPPRVAGVEVPLPLERPFTLAYRVRGVRCEAPAVLIRGPGAAGPSYVARLAGPPRRRQRRLHVRVPAALAVTIRRDDEATAGAEIAGTTVDISCAGLLVAVPQPLATDEPVAVLIDCEGVGPVRVAAQVVRVARLESGAWAVVMRIEDAEADDLRRLSRYVLERQRVLRRRELGLD